MSQKHPKTIVKVKSNPVKIHVKKFLFIVNLQTGETIFQKKAFHREVWVLASASIWFLWVPWQCWKFWRRKYPILKNIWVKTLKNFNTQIYNLIPVPRITCFLLEDAIILSKTNPCSGSTKQKTGYVCYIRNNKTMSAVFSFISTLSLKQQTNIFRCFWNLSFENSLFSNKLFRHTFRSKRTTENDQNK